MCVCACSCVLYVRRHVVEINRECVCVWVCYVCVVVEIECVCIWVCQVGDVMEWIY